MRAGGRRAQCRELVPLASQPLTTSPAIPAGTLPRLLPRMASADPATMAEHIGTFGRLPPHIDIAEVDRSGLRGRGGAGFPTGVKMRAVASARGRTVVVANGGEGEPASLKDKTLMTTAPHLVLDGAVMAARAVHATEVIVCVTRGFDRAAAAIDRAILEREGGREGVRIRLEQPPHRYVAGEESALVHWLNGGAAKPTFIPPRPFQRGVRGVPTLVQNVETLANIALVSRFGSAWFRSVGDPGEPGSRLITVSGDVAHPGVLEIPNGIRLGRLIESAGGAREHIQAFLIGGYFGPWLAADAAWDLPLTDAALRRAGGAMGAGVIVALPKTTCGVREVARVARYLADENAGQCGPCVHGLPAIAGELTSLAQQRASQGALERIARWTEQVRGRGACRHPDGAIRFVRSGIQVFASDFAKHRRSEPCAGARGHVVCPIPERNPQESWR
jgi:NADH:ubiquinone oxidoreductase subunit F (NADH-binding)